MGQGTRPRHEGDAGESGSPKSECFLGERKHSKALSFLSKAKKRLAELCADEVVGSSLAVCLQSDRTYHCRYVYLTIYAIYFANAKCDLQNPIEKKSQSGFYYHSLITSGFWKISSNFLIKGITSLNAPILWSNISVMGNTFFVPISTSPFSFLKT